MKKYSIIIPTYNDSIIDLTQLLESIKNTKYNNLEIIIIDDSDEEFKTKVSTLTNIYKCNLISNNIRKGLSHSCNQGISISKGEYLIFLNLDNIIRKDFFNKLDRHTELELDFYSVRNIVENSNDLYAGYIFINQSLNRFEKKDKNKFKRKKNISYTEGCVVRRQTLIKAGGFLDWLEYNLKAGEDLIFANRIRDITLKASYLDDIIVSHSIPNILSDFFYNRYIRGYGTIQMYYFYYGHSFLKVFSLFFFRNIYKLIKYFTFYDFIKLIRENKRIKKGYKIKYIFFSQLIELIAIFYGELNALFKIKKLFINRIDLRNITNESKILFVNSGSINKRSPIRDALVINNYNYDEINAKFSHQDYYLRKKNFKKLFFSFFDKIGLSIDNSKMNNLVFNSAIKNKYDYIIFNKLKSLKPKTLIKLKKYSANSKLIFWGDDNFLKRQNSSFNLINSLKKFDIICSIKRDNNYLNEIKKRISNDCKIVLDLPSANRLIHFPSIIKNNLNLKNNIVFCGYADKERYDIIKSLSSSDLKVDIFGSGWDKYPNSNNIKFYYKNLIDREYIETLSKYKINLNVPRLTNDDSINYKLIEYSISKIFAIHKWSPLIDDYFIEGENIITFKSHLELIKKVEYYLANENQRLNIINNCYNFVKSMKPFHDVRLKKIIELSN